MKLKEVTRTATRGLRSSEPTLSISKKGTIYFSATAMQHLGIINKEKIKFFVDEENNQAWYLSICENGYAPLSPKSRNDKSGQIHLNDIASQITGSFYHEGKTSLKFTLSEPITYNNGPLYQLKLVKESLVMHIPNPNGPIKR